MSGLQRKIDAAMREHSREEARQEIERRTTAEQQAAEQRRQKSADAEARARAARKWSPVLERMAEEGAEAADYLYHQGIGFADTLHIVRRRRDAGFFLSAKLLTVTMPAIVTSRETVTPQSDDGNSKYPTMPASFTRGTAFGIDGNTYRFNSDYGGLAKGRFCTDGPIMDIGDRFRALEPGVQPPVLEKPQHVIEEWQEALSRFAVKAVYGL